MMSSPITDEEIKENVLILKNNKYQFYIEFTTML